MHCTQLEILHKMVSILFLYGDNVIVAMVTRRVKTAIYQVSQLYLVLIYCLNDIDIGSV